MKILQPIAIGGVIFKNRIMFPPLTTGYEAKDGSISSQSRAFYTRLAQGSVGYIVLGDVAPIRSFTATPKLFEDSQIESFRLLANNLHAHGAKWVCKFSILNMTVMRLMLCLTQAKWTKSVAS